jgi:undecaprenyl-diphosphatase
VPILHAIVLGVAQGLSEFLPISSSGHLELIPWLFGWDDLTPGLDQAFDVALHLGTFAGAAAYFRRDLAALARAGVRSAARRRVEGPDERLAWLLLVSSVPAATVGAGLESTIEEHAGDPWLIGVMLVVFGVVLWAADRRLAGARPVEDFALRDALLVGSAQALALQPGVSRSGVTISAARALGFGRDAAARLSFLMSLPIIAGAGLYEAVDVLGGEGVPARFRPAFAWGVAASAVTGFAAVWLVLRVVRTRSFAPFVVYRVALGLAVLGVVASGWR